MGTNTRLFSIGKVSWLAAFALLSLPVVAQPISRGVGQQIADIGAAKANFNNAQKKIDANLVFSAMIAQGQLTGASFERAVSRPATDSRGGVTVDITGNISPGLLGLIAASGGTVIHSAPNLGTVRASLPLTSIQSVAGSADVKSVNSAARYLTSGIQRPAKTKGMTSPSARLKVALAGLVTSQGYVSHQANTVVNNLAINGSGVTVGVLSDSASAARIAALIATGDLPPGAAALPGQNGPNATDEGAAMMEIVHDMAPGANILFATADNGVASFAANITALGAAGCKIIVDDVTYFNEGAFQDGPIAQAVNAFVAGGGIYFSSAANSGNLTDGTSGTWEGDFVDGGPVSGPIGTAGETGRFHMFPGGNTYDTLTAGSQIISLKWSDPLGASTNDYDLFILDSTGTTIKAFSASVQNGTQDPFEIVQYTPAAGDRIVVVLFSGVARALRLDTNRGRLAVATSGSTYGHNAGASTVSVAATYWNSAKTGTRPFTGFANPNEVFSSDGPRKIFYNPNGTAITPGNFLFGTNGGTTLQKPDIAAADGVSARTPGFNPFFGTSAAAPHAAGIAALVLSARPTYTGAQIRTAMINTTLDSMELGVDRDSGYGIAMAYAAVQYALSH